MHTVFGSHGEIIVDPLGNVVEVFGEEFDEDNYTPIVRFDFDEYRNHYGKLSETFDILDLGYWYETKKGRTRYEPPVHGWREELNASNQS